MAVYADFTTSEGNFSIRLHDKEAPNTVENFVGLAEGTKEWTDPRTNERVRQPYYDGIMDLTSQVYNPLSGTDRPIMPLFFPDEPLDWDDFM